MDATCALGKCTDIINKFKNAMEGNAKEERRRENRWHKMERNRKRGRRKDREAEQRRELRRREAEKRERDEQKGDKSIDGEGKENSKRIKSVLGKSYTENQLKNLCKSK